MTSRKKAVKETRFTSAVSRCRRNLKYENFTSYGRLRQKLAPKSVQHDYFFLVQPIKSFIYGAVVAIIVS